MVLYLDLAFFFLFCCRSCFSLFVNLGKEYIYLVKLFRCLLISIKVFIWQLTHFVKQRCLAVVFNVNLWIKTQLKRSRFVWPLPHIAPAVISCETFPALLVSEESLKVPSALGLRAKKKCLNRMISRLLQRIIWRETFEKRRRKGYSIVSNSTLVETNVIFSRGRRK